MQIELKILPKYYREVLANRKTFELRKDDKGFSVGDVLVLREWDGAQYTGRQTQRKITYILRNCTEYGLADGYCILAMQPLEDA